MDPAEVNSRGPSTESAWPTSQSSITRSPRATSRAPSRQCPKPTPRQCFRTMRHRSVRSHPPRVTHAAPSLPLSATVAWRRSLALDVSARLSAFPIGLSLSVMPASSPLRRAPLKTTNDDDRRRALPVKRRLLLEPQHRPPQEASKTAEGSQPPSSLSVVDTSMSSASSGPPPLYSPRLWAPHRLAPPWPIKALPLLLICPTAIELHRPTRTTVEDQPRWASPRPDPQNGFPPLPACFAHHRGLAATPASSAMEQLLPCSLIWAEQRWPKGTVPLLFFIGFI
jgi:hypothetical protein